MYKYLFCLNARFSYNSFDKKEKWPQCSVLKGQTEKKKANACLISHIEKKMKEKSLKHCIEYCVRV